MISRLWTHLWLFSLMFATCVQAAPVGGYPLCRAFLTQPLPHVEQTTNYTCGPACLDSVLRYWFGRSPGERMLAIYMGTTPFTGTTVNKIVKMARMHGLHAADAYGMRLEDLMGCVARGETVVVFWNNGGVSHFSVVLGVTESSVFLMDPAKPGPYSEMPIAQFLSGWRSDYLRHNGNAVRIGISPLY